VLNATAPGGYSISPTSNALQLCASGSFVIDECITGMGISDQSYCTTCNSNCLGANYSLGEDGQYISKLCISETNRDNECAKCSGRCRSFNAYPPGQYIVGFCTGTTIFDRQCADCRISCPRNQYIAGERCNGYSNADTTYCAQCTPQPVLYPTYTTSPCTGTTSTDQTWTRCSLLCGNGEYVSEDCTETSATKCSKCKAKCAAGYFMTGSCDGTTKYDTIECVPCKSCARGQYRGNASACNGSTTYDTIQCKDCRSKCGQGQYVFGACSGLMNLDETSCKECTVCPRDKPNQYNSIYRSCNGSDTEDVVVCALNSRENSFVGDKCLPGHFSYGRMDAIDSELKKFDAEEYWRIYPGGGAEYLTTNYDALVPYIDRCCTFWLA
jgi:hypothetical protein